jgi:flagellar FliL protein
MSDSKAADPASASANKSSKLIPILTAVNLLVTLGIGGFLVFSFLKEKKTQSELKAIEESVKLSGSEHNASAGGHGETKPDAHAASTGEHGASGHGEEKKSEESKVFSMDQMTVNLANPGGQSLKFARVNISFEASNADALGELKERLPLVRNTIIDLFNSKRAGDLSTNEGRNNLREQIKNEINNQLNKGKVKDVYFTNFVITG